MLTLPALDTHYIGRPGAVAQCCRRRSGHWHWESVAGREFNCAVKTNTLGGTFVVLLEVGGRSLECSACVPVELFEEVFSEARS